MDQLLIGMAIEWLVLLFCYPRLYLWHFKSCPVNMLRFSLLPA